MKQKTLKYSANIETKTTSVCHQLNPTSISSTNRSTINGFKGIKNNKSMNGLNQNNQTNNGFNCSNGLNSPNVYINPSMNQRTNRPNNQSIHSRIHPSAMTQSTPKSVSHSIRSPVAIMAKQLAQSPSHSLFSSHSLESNELTAHSFPKTSQLSSLSSMSAQQRSQSSSDPSLQTPFAGSRFTDAPNPSLLPKPPKHWMNTNAINGSIDWNKHLITNGEHILNDGFDKKHNKSDENIFAIKLLQFYNKSVETNSIVNSGVVLNADNNRMLIKN